MSQITNLSQIPQQMREGTLATLGNGGNNHLNYRESTYQHLQVYLMSGFPFRSMFRSMIDQNAALQKMQYLIASLKGEARDVIDPLESG